MRSHSLEVVHERWHGCTKCGLHEDRRGDRITFGVGASDTDILFVGPTPNGDDVYAKTYLIGDRGSIFKEVLSIAGLDPDRCFFTPIVGCRPTVLIPATEDEEEQIKNRAPTKEEVAACFSRVEEIIYAVDPRLVVALGDTAWKAVVGTKDRGRHINTVVQAHTRLFVTHVRGVFRDVTYPVMALVDPGTMLANPSVAAHGPIATAAAALKDAATYVGWLKRNEKKDLR